MKNIFIQGNNDFVSQFLEFLGERFMFSCTVGVSIAEFLNEQLGLTQDYIDKRITTIFIDGKPVDNITTAFIRPRAILALSGAMPGLVGATLRTKSPLASFRKTITSHNENQHLKKRKGIIWIKLFNVLIKELGPLFLKKGIIVSSKSMQRFLLSHVTIFWKGCTAIMVDNISMNSQSFRERDFKSGKVFLKVTSEA